MIFFPHPDRTDWLPCPIVIDSASSAGRPAATKPLHPGRRSTKRKRKDDSDGENEPEVVDTAPRTVRIPKPGNKKRKRTSDDTDETKAKKPIQFSKTSYSRRPGNRGARHADDDVDSPRGSPPPTSPPSPAPKDNPTSSRPGQPSRTSATPTTVTQWTKDSGEISLEDIDIFVDLFNTLSTKLGRRLLFLRSPDSDLIDEVNRQWACVSTAAYLACRELAHSRPLHSCLRCPTQGRTTA